MYNHADNELNLRNNDKFLITSLALTPEGF